MLEGSDTVFVALCLKLRPAASFHKGAAQVQGPVSRCLWALRLRRCTHTSCLMYTSRTIRGGMHT